MSLQTACVMSTQDWVRKHLATSLDHWRLQTKQEIQSNNTYLNAERNLSPIRVQASLNKWKVSTQAISKMSNAVKSVRRTSLGQAVFDWYCFINEAKKRTWKIGIFASERETASLKGAVHWWKNDSLLHKLVHNASKRRILSRTLKLWAACSAAPIRGRQSV